MDILLKLDGIVEWPWVTVLWPLFIVLSILFITSLASLFTVLTKLCNWVIGDEERAHRVEQSIMQEIGSTSRAALGVKDASASCKLYLFNTYWLSS